MSKVICYQYVIVGHFASNCPDGLLKLQETQANDKNDTKEADEHMMQEAVYLNEKNVLPNMQTNTDNKNIWYLDNNASNHMNGYRRYFYKTDNTITRKVSFGDDSRIYIKGKGTISFIDMNGESRKMIGV